MPTLHEIVHFFTGLQQEICGGLEALDGKALFKSDHWIREEGGGGDTRVITGGDILEKGGVNFSHVFGALPEVLKSEARNGQFFHATGVSIVLHSSHPYVPVIHMNVRYFEMSAQQDGPATDSWFGGGIDLSPAYPNEGDTRFFHQSLKDVCDRHDTGYYARFKPWCDEYFTIKHRKEMRGVGGIFFDHLRPDDQHSADDIFAFVQDVGRAFVPIYSEIANRNRHRSYTEAQKQWQYIRRGRYAEFNLVYDRGTTFGLRTNGRTESILMSLPPRAEWHYDVQPAPGSEEAGALPFFQPQDWA